MVISHPPKRALPVRLVECLYLFHKHGLACALSRTTLIGTRGLYGHSRYVSRIGKPEQGKLTMHNAITFSIFAIELYRTHNGVFL